MKLLVCIPHVPGRAAALANCVRSYERNTPVGRFTTEPFRKAFGYANSMNLSIVDDARSAGEGWNRCAEQGLEWWPDTTHIHFSNDDVAVAPGWLEPLVDAADRGFLPASRIEPAGGHVRGEQIFQDHPPVPDWTVNRDKTAYFYADVAENQPLEDMEEVDHGNLPFCTVEQWRQVGPFPMCHYFTDTYFYHRGKELGMPPVARMDSVIYNYNINVGRHRGEWTEQDFIDFDGMIALPAYQRGSLPIDMVHPFRETAEGLAKVREFREDHKRRCTYCGNRMDREPPHTPGCTRPW